MQSIFGYESEIIFKHCGHCLCLKLNIVVLENIEQLYFTSLCYYSCKMNEITIIDEYINHSFKFFLKRELSGYMFGSMASLILYETIQVCVTSQN